MVEKNRVMDLYSKIINGEIDHIILFNMVDNKTLKVKVSKNDYLLLHNNRLCIKKEIYHGYSLYEDSIADVFRDFGILSGYHIWAFDVKELESIMTDVFNKMRDEAIKSLEEQEEINNPYTYAINQFNKTYSKFKEKLLNELRKETK